jgi:hypothetical protein
MNKENVVFIYNGILFSHQKMKFCSFHVNGWNWRTSSSVKLARFRKPKATCCLSYMKYRLNAKYKQYYEKQVTLRRGHI